MNALSIDCAVSKLTVSAKKDTQCVKLTYDIGMKQSEKILPAIDFVMREAALTTKDLSYTALTMGPGSFTGLRLGLSALKALTLSNGVPLYGVPSLEAYAWSFFKNDSLVLSVIEAKEDEYFYQIFENGKKIQEAEDDEVSVILSKLDKTKQITLCGPAAKTCAESLLKLDSALKIKTYLPENDATESLFIIAEEMIKNNIPPLADYDGPLYVRKSEAEIVLEKKMAEAN